MTPDKLETQLRGVGVSGPELSSPSSLPVQYSTVHYSVLYCTVLMMVTMCQVPGPSSEFYHKVFRVEQPCAVVTRCLIWVVRRLKGD